MDLDATLERSKSFFTGHAVALDLSAVRLSPNGIAHLVAELGQRNIRVLGIEGVEPIEGAGLPPILRGGRGTQDLDLREPERTAAGDAAPRGREQPASLLLDEPVR